MIRGWRGFSLVVIATQPRVHFNHATAMYATRYLSLLSDDSHKTSPWCFLKEWKNNFVPCEKVGVKHIGWVADLHSAAARRTKGHFDPPRPWWPRCPPGSRSGVKCAVYGFGEIEIENRLSENGFWFLPSHSLLGGLKGRSWQCNWWLAECNAGQSRAISWHWEASSEVLIGREV